MLETELLDSFVNVFMLPLAPTPAIPTFPEATIPTVTFVVLETFSLATALLIIFPSDFITTLPQGYKTNVGELGGNLSSGERQRLGIARAFLHDGDILILDEPTSNLDTLNEAEILKSLENHCKDKTVVMVSHRKSSAAICDKKIYVKNNTLSYN